jgi:hypothetical protein
VNTVKISLSTTYDIAPSHLEIECLGEVIFDGELTKKLIFDHKTERSNPFKIKIKKTGMTWRLGYMNGRQEVVVESITLNGIDLKVKEFGSFSLKNNAYVNDDTIQTNRLNLNGEWTLELPNLNLVGDVLPFSMEEIRDSFSDSEIACFGCSQTWGYALKNNETWPSQLKRLTGKLVKNYGVYGSNINEITAMVNEYLEKFDTDVILLYLPHTFRRQIREGNKILNIRYNNEINRDLLLHGEEHSIAVLSGSFNTWLEKISKQTKIYFGTYQNNEYKLFEKTPLKKFMFPFLDGSNYPKASDGIHHGAEFNRDFAKMLVDFLDLG